MFAKIKQPSGSLINSNLEIFNCDHLNHKMDPPIRIVPICLGKSIRMRRVNTCHIFFQNLSQMTASQSMVSMGGSRGGVGGGPDPLKNYKNKGFLCDTGPDHLKNHKATKPAFNVGPSSPRQRNDIQWRFAGGPMMAHS